MAQISRSEMKRQFKQVEAAAKELVQLSGAELKKAPVSETTREEIALCQNTKGGARKRQVKYIAKLLHNERLDEIFVFLKDLKGSKLQQNRYLHEAERLRDAVVNDALQAYQESIQFDESWSIDWPCESIEQVLLMFPGIDESELRTAAHRYARSRNKVYYRELFRLIKAAADKERLPLR